MGSYDYILDNRTRKVSDYLRQLLSSSDNARLVSAYFSIFGFDALEEELNKLQSAQILFGEPSLVGTVDPQRKEKKSFTLKEDGHLTPDYTLSQNFIAKRCKEWLEKDCVEVRSISQNNFLHGKMYLTTSAHSSGALVGSSNFTARGLGEAQADNIEINLAIKDENVLKELCNWFDEIWRNKNLTKDVKKDVLSALERIGRDLPPELIYFKTLYELFREELERRSENDEDLTASKLCDTKIWETLYQFQKDGAQSAILRLIENNGCILADSVGLGKTFTALAVIKFFELRNEQVLVLCPKRLYENWALYPVYNSDCRNPFRSDRFGYTILSHTDLTRYSGYANGIDLSNFNWSNFGLIVIDESHNFRNISKPRDDGQGRPIHSRYSRLLEDALKQGSKTKVLMLSATPVNTTLLDLRNQIYLITEQQEDAFRDLGINNIKNAMARAEKKFKKWAKKSGDKDKLELLQELPSDFIHLLSIATIARSRRQIEGFYSKDIDKFGQFPEREKPRNLYPQTDIENELSYDEFVKEIEKLEFSIYQPTKYVNDDQALQRLDEEKKSLNFNQTDREFFLIAMMRTNFLKRLESAAYSLERTLQRTIDKIDLLLSRIESYSLSLDYLFSESETLTDNEMPDYDYEDEDHFVNQARTPFHFRELDLDTWADDLNKDKISLDKLRKRLKQITPERDGKLLELRKTIEKKSKQKNKKLLIFTTFKDTAEYLYRMVGDLSDRLDLKIAFVSGDETRTNHINIDNKFNEILSNFSPISRGIEAIETEIDLLIATDCISEGQNLQDCDTVVNYDIHWNPVRVIQRFGRINRIGSKNEKIYMINFWPTKNLELYLGLESRVRARMALVDVTAGGDDSPFDITKTQSDVTNELTYRDELTKLIQDEIFDLDELPESIVMSDLTFDHFFAQLLQYLEQNKDELENTPLGAFAVCASKLNFPPGIIFFVRQRRSGSKAKNRPSPIYPYYGVYIRDDGGVHIGCSNVHQILNVFQKNAINQNTPNIALCDKVAKETQSGKKMEHYENQLRRVLKYIISQHSNAELLGLSALRGMRGFIVDPEHESPNRIGNFELITWVIIHK